MSLDLHNVLNNFSHESALQKIRLRCFVLLGFLDRVVCLERSAEEAVSGKCPPSRLSRRAEHACGVLWALSTWDKPA